MSDTRGANRPRRLATVGVVASLFLAGCVGPTVTDAGYRNKVSGTGVLAWFVLRRR